MNKDIILGDWKKIKGNVKQWWAKLTDNDILLIDGKIDKLLGVLQERYGWTKEEAMKEVDKRLTKHPFESQEPDPKFNTSARSGSVKGTVGQ